MAKDTERNLGEELHARLKFLSLMKADDLDDGSEPQENYGTMVYQSKRLHRYICDYLLRIGHMDTAKALASRINMNVRSSMDIADGPNDRHHHIKLPTLWETRTCADATVRGIHKYVYVCIYVGNA